MKSQEKRFEGGVRTLAGWAVRPGIRPEDSEQVIGEKYVTCLVVACASVVVFLAGITGIVAPSTPSGGLFSGLSHIVLAIGGFVCIGIYYATKSHKLLQAWLLYPVVLYPWIRWFASNCRVMHTYHSDAYIYTIPAVASYFLGGGTVSQGNLGLALHLVTVLVTMVLELQDVECPFEQTREPKALGEQTLLAVTAPPIFVYVAMVTMVRSIQQRNAQIERSLGIAKVLAERIVRFDIDNMEELESAKKSPIEETLFSIIENLRVYKPFLPDYLIGGAESDSDSDQDDLRPKKEEEKLGETPASPGVVAVAAKKEPEDTDDRSSTGSRRSVTDHQHRHKQDPHSRLCLEMNLQQVSILSVSLQGLEALAKSTGNPKELTNISNYFAQAVSDVVTSNKGVVLRFGSGWLIAGWNVVHRLASHAERACRAAIQLHNMAKEAADAAAEAAANIYSNKENDEKTLWATYPVRAAVWTGRMAVGAVGSTKLMTVSEMGEGVAELQWLEKFASFLGVPILANQAVFTAVKTHLNLVPVDVVQFVSKKSIETVYQVKEEHQQNIDEWMYTLQDNEVKQSSSSYQKALGNLTASPPDYEAVKLNLEEWLITNPADSVAAGLLHVVKDSTNLPQQHYFRRQKPPWQLFPGDFQRPAMTMMAYSEGMRPESSPGTTSIGKSPNRGNQTTGPGPSHG